MAEQIDVDPIIELFTSRGLKPTQEDYLQIAFMGEKLPDNWEDQVHPAFFELPKKGKKKGLL